MKKLVILISNTGTGTNLQAIIDNIHVKKIHAHILAVISDEPDAKGLIRAKEHTIQTIICDRKEQLLPILKRLTPDYIVLSGWKQFITDDVIDAYPNQIINLHPGLIPDITDGIVKNPDGTDGLWNKSKLTDVAIQNIFDQKATYGGSSIHFLTHEFDFGPVLSRCFEKVLPGDTIESFYGRLKKKENQMYVEVLQKLCN